MYYKYVVFFFIYAEVQSLGPQASFSALMNLRAKYTRAKNTVDFLLDLRLRKRRWVDPATSREVCSRWLYNKTADM
jgi:hypothetical protein